MDNRQRQLPEKYVITIGRTFGSGGRALGRLIADKLGIAFYDKQLLVKAAEKSGLSTEYFEKNDERMPTFISGLFSFNLGYNPMAYYTGSTSISSDSIYKAQCDFIHELADGGPCVIVGRSADRRLRQAHPRARRLRHPRTGQSPRREDRQATRQLLQLLHRQTMGPRQKLRPLPRLIPPAPRHPRRLRHRLPAPEIGKITVSAGYARPRRYAITMQRVC